MRRSWLVAGAVVALAVTAFAVARVFAPGDTLDRAHGPYPAPVAAYGRVYGELMHAPLLVGTRMRVYGAQNRIWADGPVDDKMPTSALWPLSGPWCPAGPTARWSRSTRTPAASPGAPTWAPAPLPPTRAGGPGRSPSTSHPTSTWPPARTAVRWWCRWVRRGG